jgi:hypothetical protein
MIYGTEKNSQNITMNEEIEIWARNPVDCIKHLLDNPKFHGDFDYEPVHQYSLLEASDEENNINGVTHTTQMDTSLDGASSCLRERLFNESCTGDWWWETQVCRSIHSNYLLVILNPAILVSSS